MKRSIKKQSVTSVLPGTLADRIKIYVTIFAIYVYVFRTIIL
ncbi:hypothetical protein [uncultured Christiangramia sp.]|nr:hypothetical protein [uncultured Christiangramia sp.]